MRTCAHPCRECAMPVRTSAMREVVGQVAAYYEIDPQRIANITRRDRLTNEARKAAAWILAEMFPSTTYETIAPLVGYRERSGVGHAIRRVESGRTRYSELWAAVQDLRRVVAA